MNVTPDNILEFWFADSLASPEAYKQRLPFWYSVSEEKDLDIRERFGATLEAAEQGELDSWRNDSSSLLALTILVDQFPRNIYRGSAAAYHYDSIALGCCMETLDREKDLELLPGERMFQYMPLQHAEELGMQNLSVECYEKLLETCGKDYKEVVQGGLNFAIKHRDIIQKFGRFPHRNDVLGRESTPEELEFLRTAERFGQ
jgi:uncharacterized protein (DUF924 family)